MLNLQREIIGGAQLGRQIVVSLSMKLYYGPAAGSGPYSLPRAKTSFRPNFNQLESQPPVWPEAPDR